MLSKAVKKYLAYYAETEVQWVQLPIKCYDYVCVIPVCNEAEDCLNSIFTNIATNSVLIIVVVNSSIVTNNNWQFKNQQFINALTDKAINEFKLSHNCSMLEFEGFNDVLLLDRNTQGLQINSDYGVGLARKIGCDIALKFYTQGIVKYPRIYSTDADVILPYDYFVFITDKYMEFSAISLDFEHVTNDAELAGYQFYYDFKIRYYHAGITYAGSAYDYIPLGSCLIIDCESYAQVRGFPKKNAGEDFYLLNKLAKIKLVNFDQNNPIMQIRARFSERVPFGTGPALNMIKNLHSVSDYTYYNPECFIILKKWIGYLSAMWCGSGLVIKPPEGECLLSLYDYFNCENVFSKSLRQIHTEKNWQQFIHQWFDSFKTLKAIHFFDKKLPRLNYLQLLNSKSFAKVTASKLQKLIDEAIT